MGRTLPCVVGKGGIRQDKQEGDGATPAGVHQIVGGFYRADRLTDPAKWGRLPVPMNRLSYGDVWSDDIRDPDYNHGFFAPDHPFSHERLWRGDHLYDLVLLTDWNWPNATPGDGSAIFIHRWRKPGHPTEGCVAFDPTDLGWIIRNLRRSSRLVVLPRH